MKYKDLVVEDLPSIGKIEKANVIKSGPPYPPEEVEQVKAIQSALEKLGYSVGNTGIDGKYGPRTTRAVRAFKKDFKINTPSDTMTDDDVSKLKSAKKLDKPSSTGNEQGGGAFDYGKAVPVDDLKPSKGNFDGKTSKAATIRYNNPGGMYPASWQKRFGGTQGGIIGGGHKIAMFPDMINGGAALFALLNGSMYVNKPVASAMRTWTGGNNTGSYIRYLRNNGIDTNEVVGNFLANKDAAVALASAMARWETGHPYPMGQDDWERAYRKANIG